jgi:hypothetical protein
MPQSILPRLLAIDPTRPGCIGLSALRGVATVNMAKLELTGQPLARSPSQPLAAYPSTPPRQAGFGVQSTLSPQFVLEDEERYTHPSQPPADSASAYSFSSEASSGGPLTPQAAYGASRDYFGQRPTAKEAAHSSPQIPARSYQLEGRPSPAPLKVQTFDPSLPALASPFVQAPPPSPVIAWNPIQRRTGGNEDDMETLVARPRARPTMAGRDTGEERRSVFWRRFSLVVHQAERQPEPSSWLRRHDGAVGKVRIMGWTGLAVVCCLVGGLLAWHFLAPSTRPKTGNLPGLVERRLVFDAADLALVRSALPSHGSRSGHRVAMARLRPDA